MLQICLAFLRTYLFRSETRQTCLLAGSYTIILEKNSIAEEQSALPNSLSNILYLFTCYPMIVIKGQRGLELRQQIERLGNTSSVFFIPFCCWLEPGKREATLIGVKP